MGHDDLINFRIETRSYSPSEEYGTAECVFFLNKLPVKTTVYINKEEYISGIDYLYQAVKNKIINQLME